MQQVWTGTRRWHSLSPGPQFACGKNWEPPCLYPEMRVLFFLWRGWKCSLAKATSLGELLEQRWPVPLPEASWGKGGVGTATAQGLHQLVLVYSSDVWAFHFNCLSKAPLKSKKRWGSNSHLHLWLLSVTWSTQWVKFPGLCLSQWGSIFSWGLLFCNSSPICEGHLLFFT